MGHIDKCYKDLVEEVLEDGDLRVDRTGVGTKSIFGSQYKVDLREGFPLLTTKKVAFHKVYYELMAFLRGETSIRGFEKCKNLWQPWAKEGGDLGPIYGKQWVNWEFYNDKVPYEETFPDSVNQISELFYRLKFFPYSRRHIVSAWNVADLEEMALPPCHVMFQCYVREVDMNRHEYGTQGKIRYLDLQLYQRSADLALGLPFNTASYSLLLTMIAKKCNMIPRYFIHSLGDVHIYCNHISKLEEQIKRKPKESPRLELSTDLDFWQFPYRNTSKDYSLVGYDPHPPITYKVAV